MLSYADKRVVVSGCHSGIGEAVTRLLVALGAEVHGLDRIAPTAQLAGFTQFDLGDPASIEAAVAKLDGRVDCLFNCAGVAPGLPALDTIRVNFLGTRRQRPPRPLRRARLTSDGPTCRTSINSYTC